MKIRAEKSGDFVVVGFTPPKGARGGFGALHLADWVRGKLVYAGRAGSGFSDRMLKDLLPRLEEKARDTPPCEGPIGDGLETDRRTDEETDRRADGQTDGPAKKKSSKAKTAKKSSRVSSNLEWITALPDMRGTTWIEPEMVAEVHFTEWTPEGVLRHPVFVRFRDDKAVKDVVRQEGPGVGGASAEVEDRPSVRLSIRPSVPAPEPAPEPPTLQLSNLKKIYWPEDGYTKGDLIGYYKAIAPRLLPYMIDRPLVLTRYPDGIDGKSFYQKDAPAFAPEWIRTVGIWSEDTQREIRLLRGGKRRRIALHRQHGHDPAASLGQPGRDPGAPGLVCP